MKRNTVLLRCQCSFLTEMKMLCAEFVKGTIRKYRGVKCLVMSKTHGCTPLQLATVLQASFSGSHTYRPGAQQADQQVATEAG